MREVAAGIGGLLAIVFIVVQVVFWGGTGLGVVREHCLDVEGSSATQANVDSGWTYILWPPSFFANADPAGTCVRNAPLREGLDAVGIWELPTPEQQVRDHIQEQLAERDRN